MASVSNPSEQDLYVIKRDGKREVVSFDKILMRVKNLGMKPPALTAINFSQLVMKVIDQLYNNMPTYIIDELTAQHCASLCTKHLEYGTLASRIIISNNHKTTPSSFASAMHFLYTHPTSNLNKEFYKTVMENKTALDAMLDYNRDYDLDYFGFKTLERAYLMKVDGKIIVERPQHMWMRVAVAIHKNDLAAVKETYDMMSQKYFTHATPTLFNAGTMHQQMSSCYLLGMEDDSIDGIYNTVKDCATISKWAGGIGLHVHNVRAAGSHIRGTNGTSNGIVPMLRVFNSTARYVDQGGGKRNGSIAIYLEPWHADIEDFLSLKKNHGDEEMRARDLFYGLWIPSLFMQKVQNDEMWALFCPHKCPGLADCYGEKFAQLYDHYLQNGLAAKVIKARELWFRILDSQMETGTPYLLYKDEANMKSNQKNLGVIKSSNLCTEIIEYSDKQQTAVCNLASIGLNKFVDPIEKTFDYAKLHDVTKIVTTNLNKIIDFNFYPTGKTLVSNKLHRPIGIGVQGLADVFALMDVPFHSDVARAINKCIFETMYHAALERSNELAIERLKDMTTIQIVNAKNNLATASVASITANNEIVFPLYKKINPLIEEFQNLKYEHLGAYSSFEDSPTSHGILQFDMWQSGQPDSGRYDWASLKNSIVKYGLRNSLLLAPMPTASTSQILGNNECFEPFTSNIYSRRTNAGEFVIVNKYLMTELLELGIWNDDIKNNIILNKGSIQQIDCIPSHIKEKYKIVWEIPMKHIIDMAADRAPFICQSQSMNLWMEDPDYKTLTSMHFYAWNKGLKTGMYYLRRKAKHQAQQFTIAPTMTTSSSVQNNNMQSSATECEMCSS